jgi:hypothetical protein
LAVDVTLVVQRHAGRAQRRAECVIGTRASIAAARGVDANHAHEIFPIHEHTRSGVGGA